MTNLIFVMAYLSWTQVRICISPHGSGSGSDFSNAYQDPQSGSGSVSLVTINQKEESANYQPFSISRYSSTVYSPETTELNLKNVSAVSFLIFF